MNLLFVLLTLFSLLEEKRPACQSAPIQESSRQLLIFVSFSVPLETWKTYDAELQKRGGIFVLRGIPENSFQRLAEKLKELRVEGVHSPIDIDPEAFETYGIQEVPAIVYRKEGRFDKIFGNIPLEEALRLFKEKGETQ